MIITRKAVAVAAIDGGIAVDGTGAGIETIEIVGEARGFKHFSVFFKKCSKIFQTCSLSLSNVCVMRPFLWLFLASWQGKMVWLGSTAISGRILFVAGYG